MAPKATDKHRTKFLLDEKDIPTRWYNIQADLKTPLAPMAEGSFACRQSVNARTRSRR